MTQRLPFEMTSREGLSLRLFVYKSGYLTLEIAATSPAVTSLNHLDVNAVRAMRDVFDAWLAENAK